MDSPLDFQRVLENMDKLILDKRRELEDLEEKLEISREKQAKDIFVTGDKNLQSSNNYYETEVEQRKIYENQIATLNDELNELEAINIGLVREIKELNFDVEASRVAFNSIKDKYQSLGEACVKLSQENESLKIKLDEAEEALFTNNKLLEKSHKEDEMLMEAFNSKLEALKATIFEKEEQIKELTVDNKFALDLFGLGVGNRIDNENNNVNIIQSENKQKLIEIAAAFREKDEQIELLRSQLQSATEDLVKNAGLLEKVGELTKIKELTASNQLDEFPKGATTHLSSEDLAIRIKLLEDELETKDDQLHEANQRSYYYEAIMPRVLHDIVDRVLKDDEKVFKDLDFEGFAESLKRISTELTSSRDLLNALNRKDNEITSLVNDLNHLDAKFNLVQHQCNILQEKKIPINDSLEDSPSKLFRKSCSKQIQDRPVGVDRKKILQENDIIEDKSDAKDAPFSSTSDSTIPKPSVRSSIMSVVNSRRLKELESENNLLELAMKEILMSIKWSDSKCKTILIDSPALERLCQLIEARYITKLYRNPGLKSSTSCLDIPEPNFLFQMITIKSELDLLRGQNDQLRADLKLQTREYFQILEETGTKFESSKLKEMSTKDTKSDFSCQVGIQSENDLERNIVDDETQSRADKGQFEINVKSTVSQTDQIIVESIYSESSWLKIETEQISACNKERNQNDEKCDKCVKLTQLSSHLLQCIVRVERKVTLSEEFFTDRLKNLQNLVQMLERDLELRENLLRKTVGERNLVDKQRRYLESKLKQVEHQLEAHIKNCPSYGAVLESGSETEEGASTINNNLLKISMPTNTISLLKAIIVCLQTRLSFKDRRLEQLETLITAKVNQVNYYYKDSDKLDAILSERRQSR